MQHQLLNFKPGLVGGLVNLPILRFLEKGYSPKVLNGRKSFTKELLNQ